MHSAKYDVSKTDTTTSDNGQTIQTVSYVPQNGVISDVSDCPPGSDSFRKPVQNEESSHVRFGQEIPEEKKDSPLTHRRRDSEKLGSDKIPEKFQTWNEENDDDDEYLRQAQCGSACCRPKCLQCLAKNLWGFIIFYGFCSLSLITLNQFLTTQVASMERYFKISSSSMGIVLSANDIGSLAFVLLGSHFGKFGHIPRVLAGSAFTVGILSISLSLMQAISPVHISGTAISGNGSMRSAAYLCLNDTSGMEQSAAESNMMQTVSQSTHWGYYMTLVALIVIGALQSYRIPLQLFYIDQNVRDTAQSGVLLGVMVTAMVFGSPLALLFGGVISDIPVDLSETSMDSRGPQIGAWWLGYVIIGAVVVVTSVPVFLLPRYILYDEDSQGEAACCVCSRKEGEAEETNFGIDKVHTPDIKRVSLDTKRMSLDTKRVSLDTKRVSLDTKRVSLDTKRVSLDTKRVSLDTKRVSLDTNRRSLTIKRVSLFSRRGSADTRRGSLAVSSMIGDREDPVSATFLEQLKEWPRSFRRVIAYPVVVLLLIDIFLNLCGSSGSMAFLMKYIALQFDMPASTISFYLGYAQLGSGLLGTFMGGFLVTQMRLTTAGMYKLVFVAQIFAFCCSLSVMFMACPDHEIVGFNREHGNMSMLDCDCNPGSAMFVCGSDGINYLSPCMAGCQQENKSRQSYEDCLLIGRGGRAESGFCEKNCSMFNVFIGVYILMVITFTMTMTPRLLMLARSVEPIDEPLVSGIGTLMFTLGSLLGPIIFGPIIDSTCLFWSPAGGICQLYDKEDLRMKLPGTESIIRGSSLLFLGLATIITHIQQKRRAAHSPEQDADGSDVETKDINSMGDDTYSMNYSPDVSSLGSSASPNRAGEGTSSGASDEGHDNVAFEGNEELKKE